MGRVMELDWVGLGIRGCSGVESLGDRWRMQSWRSCWRSTVSRSFVGGVGELVTDAFGWVDAANDGGAVDSEPPTDYSYLFDPDSALGSNQLETLSPSESMFGSGGSDGRSTVESPIDRDDDDYVEEGTKTRGKKRKSEGGDARAGNRKKVA